MKNLLISTTTGYADWSTGSARFSEYRIKGWRVDIGVRCRIEHWPVQEVALLDTGSTFSVIGGETAEALKHRVFDLSVPTVIRAHEGLIEGGLCSVDITLLAEMGQNLTVSGAQVFIPRDPEDWAGPPVLGYQGFLDRIKIALDPGARLEDGQVFRFGGYV